MEERKGKDNRRTRRKNSSKFASKETLSLKRMLGKGNGKEGGEENNEE